MVGYVVVYLGMYLIERGHVRHGTYVIERG